MNDDRKRKAESPSTKEASPPRFTVTYSRLCDGGSQEMVAAVSCVKEIFPDATIRTNRRGPEEDRGDPNPSVVISLDNESLSSNSHQGSARKNNGNNNVLWSAQQRNLYEKYPKKRRRSMINIRKTLEAFKISLSSPAAGKEKEEPTTSVTTNSDEDDNEDEPASFSTDTAVCEYKSIRKAAAVEESPNDPETETATTTKEDGC